MKKILVPVDFSKFSKYAVETAVQIAKKSNSEIVLIHVVEPIKFASVKMSGVVSPSYSLDNSKLKDEAVKEAQPKLDAYVATVKSEGIEVDGIVSTHSKGLYMDIETITEFGADLIIIGTKGEKDFVDEMLIGSNTLKVIQEAKCPVLVIREKPAAHGFKNVVYATHFAETDKTTFDELIEFAYPEGAHLHLVSVVTKSDFREGKELTALKDKMVEEFNVPKHSYFIYPDVKPAEGIVNAASYLNADLIVLPNKGKKGIELWVKGSVTENLLKKTTLPVLTHNMTHRHDIMG